jgi:anti-sigma factor RsiW
MTCREFVEFLMAYLDRELEARQRDVFEGHMRQCPACVAYLDTYRTTVALGAELGDPDSPVPEEVPDELVRAILAARES